MIAVSSEHRKEAIEATAFVIEAVKRTATIWKKVHCEINTITTYYVFNLLCYCIHV